MQNDPTKAAPRFNILGVPVDAVDMPAAMATIDRLIKETSRCRHVLAVNPEKVYAVQADPMLREVFRGAALLIPDGIGVVLALRVLYGSRVSRVPGADLMQKICAVAPARGYRIFIYGGSEEVNDHAVAELERRHPGIQIVGRANGYLGEHEMPSLVDRINAAKPDVLFVALGSPRQEQWMHRWSSDLNVKVCQGIGGTLDTIVGRVDRAPSVWQRMGLEWLFRLMSEPSRARRQLQLPVFAWDIAKAKIGFGVS